MTQIYGIHNCDTVKKALKWLDAKGIDYQFHDFRKNGLSLEDISLWLEQIGADLIVNKRSTTWKQLSEAEKSEVIQGDIAMVLQAHPTLIKRPVVQHNKHFSVGFKPEQFQQLFA